MGLDITAHNSSGEEFAFHAGSYQSQKEWRKQLIELSGQDVREERISAPFSELINFSDCEGVIDSVVAKKLAIDFATFQHQADSYPDESFRRKYTDWRKAFELAADGFVEFR